LTEAEEQEYRDIRANAEAEVLALDAEREAG
jgi:hypothetical protein